MNKQLEAETKELTTKDHAMSHAIHEKAHRASIEAIKAMSAQAKLAETSDSWKPIAEHINGVIRQTGTFGIAQHLINDIADLTDSLNKSLENSKGLFQTITEENQAQAEVYRAVAIAHYLKTVIEEVSKGSK
jgi:hypothetical protein